MKFELRGPAGTAVLVEADQFIGSANLRDEAEKGDC
jgi:hypothetical protein